MKSSKLGPWIPVGALKSRILFQESLEIWRVVANPHIRTDDFCRPKNWMNLCYPNLQPRVRLSHVFTFNTSGKTTEVGNPAKRHGVARTRTWLALRMCLGKVSVLATPRDQKWLVDSIRNVSNEEKTIQRENRWGNTHVLIYHGPLNGQFFFGSRGVAIYFHHYVHGDSVRIPINQVVSLFHERKHVFVRNNHLTLLVGFQEFLLVSS